MKNAGRFASCISVALLLTSCRDSGTAPEPAYRPEFFGCAYTSFDSRGFSLGEQSNALGELVTQTGSNTVALSVFEYQSTATSHDIAPNTTGINPLNAHPWPSSSTTGDLRTAILDAHNRSLRILLKPHIDLYSGERRAAIVPDSQWFSSYRIMIQKYARLCAENSVEILCMGVEYVFATQPQFTPQWKALIDSVRKVYGGMLTYAANWNDAVSYGITQPEYTQVGFWSSLEYVGVDAYYRLTSSSVEAIPSFEVGLSRMRVHSSELGAFSRAIEKKILLTEIGVQSTVGALASPWDYAIGNHPSAQQDVGGQNLYYRVALEAFGSQSWCAGMLWWNWESVASSTETTNYTPRNKPAALTMKRWYQQQAF
jgi:hypothetical protein